MSGNQSATGLNRGLSSNFWWLRCANYVEFIEVYAMSMEKLFFSQKKYLQTEKKVDEMETYWLSDKVKVTAAVIIEEAHTDSLEEIYPYWFPC